MQRYTDYNSGVIGGSIFVTLSKDINFMQDIYTTHFFSGIPLSFIDYSALSN